MNVPHHSHQFNLHNGVGWDVGLLLCFPASIGEEVLRTVTPTPQDAPSVAASLGASHEKLFRVVLNISFLKKCETKKLTWASGSQSLFSRSREKCAEAEPMLTDSKRP